MEGGERLLSISTVRPFSLAAGLMRMDEAANEGAVVRKEEVFFGK